MKTIQYAIDTQTNLVVSRVGSVLAWPILEYDKMLPENDYAMNYSLDKISVLAISRGCWTALKWTRRITKEIKNIHREFWGFSKLK